jgi:hypothetical protein
MNLHNQLPSNIYVISTATTNQLPPAKGKFFSITCTAAGTVSVKGGAGFERLASGATGTSYIDPSTGVAHTGNTAAEGFFEKLSSVELAIPMIAGQTIYGRFDSLKSDGTFTGFAYAG